MTTLRRIPLGARLGAAFAILAVALVAVGLVGVRAIRSLDVSSASSTNGRTLKAIGFAADAGEGAQASAHNLVRHLYVYDGDLKTEDAIAKVFNSERGEVAKDLGQLRALATDEDVRAGVAKLTAAWSAYSTPAAKAIAASRRETIDAVDERDGSRTTYTATVVPALQRFDSAHQALTTHLAGDSAEALAAAADRSSSGQRSIWIVLGLALALAVGMSVTITRSITRPLAFLSQRLRRVTEACMAELRRGLEALAHGDLTVAAHATTDKIGSSARDEVGAASAVVDELIDGMHASIAGYERSRADLAALIGQVAGSAQGVSAASGQMASSSEETGRAMNEVSHAVSDVAGGAERQVQMVASANEVAGQVAAAVHETARSTEETATAAEQARELARQGVAAAAQATAAMSGMRGNSQEVTTAMRELADKSEEIGAIVETITGIAAQTNLLALNAAIEAARAGEQGRGFAVVAEEVRKLAEESQSSAALISGLIDQIQAQTRRAVDVVEDGARRTDESADTVDSAREAFESIGQSVDDIATRIEQIAAAAQQISAGATQMRHDIGEIATVAEASSASSEQVSASTQQTSATTQEIAASAQALARTAEQLEQLVSQFTLA